MTKDQRIRSIEEGIVIDHLPPGVAWKVADILGLNKQKKGKVSLGDYHHSGKLSEGKGFIKIEGRELTSYEMNLIALVAPHATLSIIRGGLVYEKKNVKLPGILMGVIKCPNVNCISNQLSEKITSKIYCKENIFSCHYCRQNFLRIDIRV